MIPLKKYVSAFAAAALIFCGCGGSNSGKSVRESVTYELGDKVTLNAEEFIINANESDLQDAEVTSDLMEDPDYDYLGFTKEVKSKGKNYLGVGTYDVDVKYNGKTYTSKIIVEDTTPPSFISAPQSIVVAVGDTSFDPVRRFRITDKDTFDVEIEGDYDLDTPGSYDVKIIATDASGNKSSISITMKVVDGEQIITSEDQVDEDFNDINEAAQERPNLPSTNTPDNAADGEDQDKTEEDNNNNQTACDASNVSPGASYYYSFDEAYAAGTAWNQQAPGNYFFYLVGTDDCGQTIYVLTLGNQNDASTPSAPGASVPEITNPTAPEAENAQESDAPASQPNSAHETTGTTLTLEPEAEAVQQ